jgi:low temperature requirement protein LtrA
VLGEVLLAATQGIQGTLSEHGASAQLLVSVFGGLLIVFAMWWFYFKRSWVEALTNGSAFVFGYGHYVVFASVAAVGAALGAVVDVVQHEAHMGSRIVAVFLAAALSVDLGLTVLLIGLVMVGAVAQHLRHPAFPKDLAGP